MKILELYAGIGGMHYALEESGVQGEIVAAIEISTVANDVYSHNFPSTKLINRNIESLTVTEIEKLGIDAIFMSPPCQPFTKNGLQKDENDLRSVSFLHVLTLIPKLKNLKYILLENVQPFSHSYSRKKLINCLDESEFNYKECTLSPCDFGVSNSRCRYFLIAKKNNLPSCYSDISEPILTAEMIVNILSNNNLYTTMKAKYPLFVITRCPPLSQFIDDHSHGSFTSLELKKRLNVLDIRSPDSRGSCCFTSAYGRYAEGTGSVMSPLLQTEVQNILHKLKHKENESLDSMLEITNNLNLRYFTPREVSRLMCFPEKYEFPNTVSDRQKYKLLGNSVNVHVVCHLILLLAYVPVQ